MWIQIVCFIILSISFCFFYSHGKPRFAELERELAYPHRCRLIAPAFLAAVERGKLLDKFSHFHVRLMQLIAGIYGPGQLTLRTQYYSVEMLSLSFIVFTGFVLLGLVLGEGPVLAIFGLAGAGITPALLFRSLDQRLKKKKHSILIELPEFLNKIILLVDAGETVQNSFIRSIHLRAGEPVSPLQAELVKCKRELEMNVSLNKSLGELTRRCSMQEISMFTTTVLLNYKRGGQDLTVALRNLSRDLWERRKSVTRILGEEASSKLVFPMVLIFLIVMVIVAAPAMMMMG